MPTDSLLQLSAQNGGSEFNIFIKSSETKQIPRKDSRAVHAVLKSTTGHFKYINNVRYTRTGTVIVSTHDLMCTLDIPNISSLLGVKVTY